LEQKIVRTITDDTITSRNLGFLSAETEMAIATADADAQIAEATALDPLQSPDLASARATLEDARFKAERLKSLLPRLNERYERMAHKEKKAAWIVRYDALRPEVDALTKELGTAYAALVAKLVPLLNHAMQLNGEISRLNQASLPDTHGSDGGWLVDIKTPDNLVLPDPESNKNFWPPSSNINWAEVTPVFASPGDEWWKVQQAEGARTRIEDAKRADALQEEEGRVRNDPKLWRRG